MSDRDDVRSFLFRTGVIDADQRVELEPLAGGVSSDIWRVTIGERTLCIKRALAQLRTVRRWKAPISRSSYEWRWLNYVAGIVPGATPVLYAHDPDTGLIAMEYFEPDKYPVWKTALRDGFVDTTFAANVGHELGTIHAASADDPLVAEMFPTDDIFLALRLQPYLLDTAAQHPKLASVLSELAATTAATKLVLVHGDVSPKNIIVGPCGPTFIDAECAWYGDPAFDLAFVLNHLLLKCIWRPMHLHDYCEAFRVLTDAYLAHVDWEPPHELEERCARLLPALTLARIDGTSPVEYITDDRDRSVVRAFASTLLRRPQCRLEAVMETWPTRVAG